MMIMMMIVIQNNNSGARATPSFTIIPPPSLGVFPSLGLCLVGGEGRGGTVRLGGEGGVMWRERRGEARRMQGTYACTT